MSNNERHIYKGYTVVALPFENMNKSHSSRFSIHEGSGVVGRTVLLPVAYQGIADEEFPSKEDAIARVYEMAHKWIDGQVEQ